MHSCGISMLMQNYLPTVTFEGTPQVLEPQAGKFLLRALTRAIDPTKSLAPTIDFFKNTLDLTAVMNSSAGAVDMSSFPHVPLEKGEEHASIIGRTFFSVIEKLSSLQPKINHHGSNLVVRCYYV